jgi:hypothetical protein
MHDPPDNSFDTPIDGAPTWVRIVQAVLIGVVAGLAFQVLFSMVLSGNELRPIKTPTECRKNSPSKAPQQLKSQAVRPEV